VAEFVVSDAEIVLSSDERRQLLDRIEEGARDRASRRFGLLPRRPQLGELTPPLLGDRPGQIHRQGIAKRDRRIGRSRGKKPPGKMIVGPFTGNETPPYDDAAVISWNQGNVICAPYAGQLPNAQLLVRLFTGVGQQIDAWANAAIWFWAKPSTSGMIQFYTYDWDAVRYLNALTYTGAGAAGATYVQAGIVEVTLSPFSAGPMADLEELNFVGGDFQIGQNDSFKHQDTISAAVSGIPLGSTVNATLPHVYACCIWLTANLSTRGDGGVEIDASFSFTNVDIVVP
jgi:hypothetical protein